MYHYVFNIVIFSHNHILESIANRMIPMEQFEYKIQTFQASDEQVLSKGDIILWDLPFHGGPIELRKHCKKSACLIICATTGEITEMSDEDFQMADDYWEKPFDQRLLKYRFQKLLDYIKLQKDEYLNRIYLDTLIDSLPDMVWFKNCEGIHLKVNRTFCNTVGKNMDDIVGWDHCHIWNVSHDDPNSGELACKESERIVVEKGKTCQFIETVKSQHGIRQFITYKSPLVDEYGNIMGTVGMGHDITDLENLGTELEIFLRSMPFAILICNDEGYVTNVNEKFECYFNIQKEQIIGMQYNKWVATAFEADKIVNSEGFVEARVCAGESKQQRILELREESIRDVFQNVAGLLCIYRDVTVERKLEQQILLNSNTDFMTGLYNRRCFYQYVHNNRCDKTVSLLYVDLDNFKAVNDTYGHQIGDKALICTSKLLKECFCNEFIARIGGDEFLVAIFGECSIRELKNKAQHFLERMSENFQSIPQFMKLSASIGIAQTNDPNLDIDLLIQESDTALYEAKQQGRGRYCVYHPPLA